MNNEIKKDGSSLQDAVVTYKVHMLAMNEKGPIREVDVPVMEMGIKTTLDLLSSIFKYGQNDFQPKQIESVSVGDVIEIGTDYDTPNYWLVASVGFEKITAQELVDYISVEQYHRRGHDIRTR